ncbi:hypothetical protein ACP4OV_023038 [Aristida adscensionis]
MRPLSYLPFPAIYMHFSSLFAHCSLGILLLQSSFCRFAKS